MSSPGSKTFGFLAVLMLGACASGPMSAWEFPPKPGDTSGYDRDWAFSGCSFGRAIGGVRSVEDDTADCMRRKGYEWRRPQ